MTELLAVWLLSYVLHSTLLLGGAALVCFALGARRLALQEAALRAALVGAFVTATLQLGFGLEPLGGRLLVPSTPPAAAVPAASSVVAPLAPVEDVHRAATIGMPEESVDRVAERWPTFLTLAWAVLAAVGLARLTGSALRLRRLLRDRTRLQSGALVPAAVTLASRLGLRRDVRLSTAPRLAVPLARGVLRPEVCLPPRALEELPGEQQLALCAHELAHVARSDPAWLLVARMAEVLAPFQPLNTFARRRLQALAECLSDDLAVCASGHALGLARSLVDVASWMVAEPRFHPAAAAGALSSGGGLGHRVERLMDPFRTPERPRRLLLPLAGVAVLGTALVTPSVSGNAARDEPPSPSREATTPAPSAPEQELEQLSERIEERSKAHSAEMNQLEKQARELAEKSLPPKEELKKLTSEIEQASEALAEAREAERTGTASEAQAREQREEARHRLDAARDALREAVRASRPSEEEMRALRESVREAARAAAPTAEERREIRRLAREIARQSARDSQGEVWEAMRSVRDAQREALSELRDSLREMTREIGRAIRESLRETREVSHAAREAARDARDAAREAARDATREAEKGHLEGEQPSEAPAPPKPPEAPERP